MSTDLRKEFETRMQQLGLPAQSHLLLAVSGGVDSVVLCELSRQCQYKFTIAHCNFQLRGAESHRDENFVRNLATQYAVPVLVERFDTNAYASNNKLSVQEAARNLRYNWFAALQKQQGFSCTLLAHHADDNIETLLMHFFRGTGLQGLTGIPERQHANLQLYRPMLHMRRSEILDFAKRHKLQWVEDSSNSANKYTRNFLRNQLIPDLQQYYPQVQENLLMNISRFKGIDALYQPLVLQLKKKLVEPHQGAVRIAVKKLMPYLHTALLFEIISDYGFGEKQLNDAEKLLYAGTGKFIENERFQIIKHGLWLVIAPKSTATPIISISHAEALVPFDGRQLSFKMVSVNNVHLKADATVALLDAKKVEFPLVLRKWKVGDYFYPLGMPKKKKVARFLIDQKLSKNQKEDVWVLQSGKKIVWVVGYRIDDRFKITPSVNLVMQITISNP